jgi:hypothetical protein
MGAPRRNPPSDIAETIERLVAGEGASTKILARAIGVSDSLVRAWFDRDEDLKEQYEAAREAYAHGLFKELRQMCRMGKGNVAGLIYELKARFKFYDQPGSGKLVDVNVATAPTNVMIVYDHGTNEQWAAKAAEQQRKLMGEVSDLHSGSTPLTLEGAAVAPVPVYEPPAYQTQPEALASSPALDFGPPSWKSQRI